MTPVPAIEFVGMGLFLWSFCSNAEVFRRSVAYYHKKFNSIKPIHLKKECESPQNGQKGKNNGRRKENPLQNLPSGE